MSNITDGGLTQFGTRCFIAVPIWQQRASKGERVTVWIAGGDSEESTDDVPS